MSVALKSRLLRIMKAEMSFHDFHPASYCEYQIEKMVHHGVERMRIGNAVDQMGMVCLAEQNLRHLIDYFYNFSQDVGTYPTLDEMAFESALIDCPPLWPYR